MVSISSIIPGQLKQWCVDESQKNVVFTRLWRNVTHFLGGMRDDMAWENLPPELWGQIGKRLASRLDILRFRSVCKDWRSSLPYPTRFPLRVPPPPGCDPELCNLPYLITELIIYSNKKLEFVLVAFEELDQGGKFRPRILLPVGREFNYPMISFMASPEHPLSQLSFVAKAYHLRMALQDNKFAKKTVLISSDAVSVNPSYASDLTVVAHLSCGEMQGRVALLRLEGSPENWVWDTDFCSRVFEDIATYRGRLCMLDRWGRVFLMDYNSLQMIQVCDSSSIAYELQHKQLFETCGDLYLVDLSRKETVKNEAYKLSFRLQKWVKVKDIGDKILALGPFLIRARA